MIDAPFEFSLSERPEGLEVVLKLYNWRSFGKSCLIFLPSFGGLLVLFGRNAAIPSKALVIVLFLMAVLGCLGLAMSIVKRVVRFSDFGLTVRTFRLGVPGRLRRFQLNEVEQFGFGLFGHSGWPVLKFEVRNVWVVLASGVTEDEVNAFLRELYSHNVNLRRTI